LNNKIDLLSKHSAIFGAVVRGLGFGAGLSSFNLLQNAVGNTVDYVKSAIGAASDLNETINKSEVVFGPAAEEVRKFGSTAATAMGLSQQAAIEFAASFGNLFKSLGVAPAQIAPMSEAL